MFLDFENSLAYYVAGKAGGKVIEHYYDCIDKQLFKTEGSFIELRPVSSERLIDATKECCTVERGTFFLKPPKEIVEKVAEILAVPSENITDIKEGLITLVNNNYILLRNCT